MKSKRRGFTLLEMVISASLLSVIMGSALTMSLAGSAAFDRASLEQRTDAKVRRALERAVMEIEWAQSDALSPTCVTGSPSVIFQPLAGVAGGVAVWGVSRRLARVAAADDPDDGVDNDGDGVIDEGDLVLTIDPGGAGEFSITLCTQVTEMFPGETLNSLDDDGNGIADERGFNVEALGDLLTIRLSIAETSAGDTVTTSAIVTSVTLRN
jgi:prepilin-type N-terminal cleavage/methylation domain-containing protein